MVIYSLFKPRIYSNHVYPKGQKYIIKFFRNNLTPGWLFYWANNKRNKGTHTNNYKIEKSNPNTSLSRNGKNGDLNHV